MRGLSKDFMIALKSGMLLPILERIKKDDTLMLGIRDGYINIYYRGGNLIRITERLDPTKKQYSYDMFFDAKYDISEGHVKFSALSLPGRINDSLQVDKWILSIATLKELMDFWFSKNSKMEREFQQLVERENNRSPISGETEYFITDIEFADSSIGARFDILAINWPASKRKDGKNCKASFIEMKYGDGALGGESGLIKHLEDIEKFLEEKKNYRAILDVMNKQFDQLDELGLIKFSHSLKETKVQLSESDKPQFIFLIANHNPRSTKLKSILTGTEFISKMNSQHFDLRFFVSSDAGYAMHNNNMLTYKEYILCLE